MVAALVVVGQPAQAGATLTASTWSRDMSTGKTSYSVDLSLTGLAASGQPCSGVQCSWSVRGYYQDVGVNRLVVTLGSGTLAANTSSFTQTFTADNVSFPEVTHLRATVDSSSSYRESYSTQYLKVSDPYPMGSISLNVQQWDENVDTGKTDYSVVVSIQGANHINGPCDGATCSWNIEARFIGPSGNLSRGSLGSGTLSSDSWGLTQTLAASGSTLGEVTDIRATLKSSNTYKETYETPFQHVSDPYGPGSVDIAVDLWRLNEDGTTSYELAVPVRGAAAASEPCEGVACSWSLEALTSSGQVVATLGSGGLPANTWSHTGSAVGSAAGLEGVTSLRAKVTSNSIYKESYSTTRFVGDHMVGDEDMVSYEAALAAALIASPSTFCARLALEGSGLPNTNETSPPDVWEACEAALQAHGASIRQVLAAVAVAAGGAMALDLLLDEHAHDGPSPTPEEEATPVPPWNPPNGWEDNGCHWQTITYTAASEQHLMDEGHIYEYRKPGKSWFYQWVTPNLQSMAEKHALSVAPEPDPKDATKCRRIVTGLSRDVGIDRYTQEATHVYTVITWKGSGEVRTMFPGRP